MKIAILGAGISGLCCAKTFDKFGIDYDIFEKKHKVGNYYEYAGSLIYLSNKPVKNPLKYIRNNCGIDIKPVSKIKTLIMKSYKNSVTVKGDLGYILHRGQSGGSIESKLASTLNKKINFSTSIDYKKLINLYDYTIIATGNTCITSEITEFENIVSTKIKGATVLGEFDINTAQIWFNTDYARSGYAYLLPMSEKKASLILVMTYTKEENVEYMWNSFLINEKLDYEIVETYEGSINAGIAKDHKVGNVFLVGNAAGFLDPLLGVGIINAMKSGIYAAKSIALGTDFEKMVYSINNRIKKMSDYRKLINGFENKGYDKLIRFLSMPLIRNFVYNKYFDPIKYIHPFINKNV
ncbi:MAG: NAD(P)-binding protein [Thermoanaerobacteraceae bacterium]